MDNLQTALSALGGGGIALIIAKWAISRALADLYLLRDKVGEIDKGLAEIAVQVREIGKHREILDQHTEKIAQLGRSRR